MKKLLVVLLSLGLIAAFCMPAAAVEFKMGGEWYTYGIYYNNRSLQPDNMQTSRAWIYTQTRLAPVIQVAEGLKLTMRADALSKFWGGTNWRKGTDDKTSSRKQDNVNSGIADMKIQENIEIERSYVSADTALGQLSIGYMSSGTFGPDFGNDNQTRPRIRYVLPVGPVKIIGIYEKWFESDHSNYNARLGEYTDADDQQYALAATYGFEGGEVGFLYKYIAFNSNRPVPFPDGEYKTKIHAVDPYVTVTIGPVELEAEFIYMFGKGAAWDNAPAGVEDQKVSGWGGMVKAKANLGPVYVGGMFLYSSGDDDPTDNTDHTGPTSQDAAYGYIMMKDFEDSDTWPAALDGSYEVDDSLSNVTYVQAYVGFDPMEKLNVEVQMLWAKENEDRIVNQVSKEIGYEVGAKATYKIFDNLSYMVAGAYYWAGDIFKGADPTLEPGNDYMLYNKLTLEW